MNQDTKDYMRRNIAKLDNMIKALDTEIRFNKEAPDKLCNAYNHLRIAMDNMKASLIQAAPAFDKLNKEVINNMKEIVYERHSD